MGNNFTKIDGLSLNPQSPSLKLSNHLYNCVPFKKSPLKGDPIVESNEKPRKFDLEERTFTFANNVRALLKTIPTSVVQSDDKSQLSRSSGSVAANYVEANEAISTKDFGMRIRIARKEAKESHLWLRLIRNQVDSSQYQVIDTLTDEALQLVKILNAIAFKVKEE